MIKTSVFTKLIVIILLLGFIYFIADIVNSQPKNNDKIYPDSIQVLTITGDTATIYATKRQHQIVIEKYK